MESTENILSPLKMDSLCVFPLKKVKKDHCIQKVAIRIRSWI